MQKIRLAASDEVREGALLAVDNQGGKLLLTRVSGQVCAVENKCPHLGLSMSRGVLSGSTLRCPWHGSRFDVCSGANVDWTNSFVGIPMPSWTHRLIAMGKKPQSLRTVKVTESEGQVYLDSSATAR